jgi:hypothetical protein
MSHGCSVELQIGGGPHRDKGAGFDFFPVQVLEQSSPTGKVPGLLTPNLIRMRYKWQSHVLVTLSPCSC